MEEFLKQLRIDKKAEKTDDGKLLIELEDSDEYGRIYSKLDKSDLVYEDQDSSQVTFDTSSIQFESDNYLITLLADFEQDTYKLTIKDN